MTTSTPSSLSAETSDWRTQVWPWARLGWALVVMLGLILFVAALPNRHLMLQMEAASNAFALRDLAISPNLYVNVILIAEILVAVEFIVGSVVMVFSTSRNWMTLLVALTLSLLGLTAFPVLNALALSGPFWGPVVSLGRGVTVGLVLLVLYIFPDGHFVPSWGRYLTLMWTACIVLYWVTPIHAPNTEDWPFWVELLANVLTLGTLPLLLAAYESLHSLGLALMVLAWFTSGILAQIYRYRKVSGPVERQQTKWVVVGATTTFLGALAFYLAPVFIPALNQPGVAQVLYALWGKSALVFIFCLLPVCLAFSTMHYRLWDVDVLIYRTLIYGTLTVGVVALYALLVGSASTLLQTQNKWLIALLALGTVIALFQPIYHTLKENLSTYIPLVRRPAAYTPTECDTRLDGVWLGVARVAAGLALVVAVGSFGLSLLMWGNLLQSTPLPTLIFGLKPSGWQNYFHLLNFAIFVPFAVAGSVLIWRKSCDGLGLLAAFTLLLTGVWLTPSVQMAASGVWRQVLGVVGALGFFGAILFGSLFPTGQFAPRWMKLWPLALLVILPLAWWLNAPLTLPPLRESVLVMTEAGGASDVFVSFNFPIAPWQVLVAITAIVLPLGLQGYRFIKVSGPLERQRAKWLLIGAIGLADVLIALFVILAFFGTNLQVGALVFPFAVVGFWFIPLSIALAVFNYRPWDVDRFLRHTAILGTLAIGGAVAYVVSYVAFGWVAETLTGPHANWAIVGLTLVIAAVFSPLREKLQGFVDRRFYREKVDFRLAFTAFAREVRTLIDFAELLRVLVTRTTDLLHITHGAVFMRAEKDIAQPQVAAQPAPPSLVFNLAEARNLPNNITTLEVDEEELARLQEGQPITRRRDKVFPLLVPLVAPIPKSAAHPAHSKLLGLLALGPRRSEQIYTREDQALLTELADQAGTSIQVAWLIRQQRAETARREAVENHLAAHRASPIGRAETLTEQLLLQPAIVFNELYELTQLAGQSPDTASLLGHLPKMLESHGAPRLAGLAEGFNYLFTSQLAPEVLPVGLRTLISAITLAEGQDPAATGFPTAEARDAAHDVYLLCYQALEANCIPQITELRPALKKYAAARNEPTADLRRALCMLHAAAEALHASERVDTAQDKLAYLASTVEKLSQVDRLARAELGSADRAVAQRLADSWLAVVTGAMSELQTRAQIICRLLTRHTWQGEIITLALHLRNTGRGAAVNVRVALSPTSDYTAIEGAQVIERLAPGEEAQAEVRVRFGAQQAAGLTQFRVRFIITYADPRGADQVENYADIVQLLEASGQFQFIPNPYVVGTPLKANSPLFFGRADVVEFVQDSLAAAHRNNLVLIGQRRTGKTSLLKQLPARLGESYMPVYLDGQSLGLDPGLPSFFTNLATEITFALEDRGFSPEPPDPDAFNQNPATTFEYQFLPQVRALIGDRHLLILLDEFEELESAVRRGNLDASIFGFLRHLIQHSPNLSVIFCGTHRLEELAADYWNVLFNISLYRHVGFLERPEAEHLVQEPVKAFNLRYDDLALDKMWQVTAGHPYFLQLLCHSLVNRHNKTERNYMTVADVNAALDDILASGEAHFVYLWTESSRDEQLALTALSRMMPLTGHASPIQVVDFLAERGVTVDRRAMSEALHHLTLRDLLQRGQADTAAFSETYRWKLGLLGLWVEKYRSLSRVLDEAK